jgi:hypothetical protein
MASLGMLIAGFEHDLAKARAENDRLRAALDQIIEIDHYPDATIARKARAEHPPHVT